MSSQESPHGDGTLSNEGSSSNFEEIRSKFNNGFPNNRLKGKNNGKGGNSKSKSSDSIGSQNNSPTSPKVSKANHIEVSNVSQTNPARSPKGIELVNSISDEDIRKISAASVTSSASHGEHSPMLAKTTPSKLPSIGKYGDSAKNGDSKEEEEIQYIDLQSPSYDYQEPIYIECEGEGIVRQVFHSPDSNGSSSPEKRHASRSSSTSAKTQPNANSLTVQTDFPSINIGGGKARTKSSSGEGEELFPRRDTFSNMQSSALQGEDEDTTQAAQDREKKREFIQKLNRERDFFSSLELSAMGAVMPKDSVNSLNGLDKEDDSSSKQGSAKSNRGIMKKGNTLRKAAPTAEGRSAYLMKKLRRAIVLCIIMFLLGTGTVMIASKFFHKKQIEQDVSTFFTHLMKQIDSQTIVQQHIEVLSIVTNEIDASKFQEPSNVSAKEQSAFVNSHNQHKEQKLPIDGENKQKNVNKENRKHDETTQAHTQSTKPNTHHSKEDENRLHRSQTRDSKTYIEAKNNAGHENHDKHTPTVQQNAQEETVLQVSSTEKNLSIQHEKKPLTESKQEAEQPSHKKTSNKATPNIQILNITTTVNKASHSNLLNPSVAQGKAVRKAKEEASTKGIMSRIGGNVKQFWQNVLMRWQNWIVNLLTIRKRK
jgi:hypothetical protein